MVNLNPFKRKPPPMTELQASVANGVAQVAAGRQASDVQQQRELQENAMLINDVNINSLLEGMAKFTITDTKGELGGEPNQKYTYAVPKYVAASIANSHLMRTGWIEEKDARIMDYEMQSIFLRMEMQLSEEEYEQGGSLILDTIYENVKMNMKSSINGRIAKLVKSRPHQIDVSVGSSNPKERVG